MPFSHTAPRRNVSAHLFAVLLLAGLTTAGCGSTHLGGPGAIDATADLLRYLDQEGITAQPTTASVQPMLTGIGRSYRLPTGDLLEIYEYRTPRNEAREDSRRVNRAEFTASQRACVYQEGELIVAYYGRDARINTILSNALGIRDI